MDWTNIIYALVLGAMIIFIWPNAKHMLKNSPKGSGDDWRGFLIPMAAIVLFVVFLVMMTRK